MVIDLSEVKFSYDFFTSTMPDGSTLILNNVSESLLSDGETTGISQVNIIVEPVSGGNSILCSSVIGTGNEYLMLSTEHTEYLGKLLTEDTMQYCTLTLYEEGESTQGEAVEVTTAQSGGATQIDIQTIENEIAKLTAQLNSVKTYVSTNPTVADESLTYSEPDFS